MSRGKVPHERKIFKNVACFILLNLKFEYGTGTKVQSVTGSRSHNKITVEIVLQRKFYVPQ